MLVYKWTYLPIATPKKMSSDAAMKCISSAMAEWNAAMYGLVRFEQSYGDSQIYLFFGSSIDYSLYPDRIAQCKTYDIGRWDIEFDVRRTWNTGTWWNKLLRGGENLKAAALHEIGHTLRLPHASDPEFIMHPLIPDKNSFSKFESRKYRDFYSAKKYNP